MESSNERGNDLTKPNILEKLGNFLGKITVYLAIISVGALALDLIMAVFSRYVLKTSITAAGEIALYLLAWSTFLGASLGVRRNELVAVTFLIEKLGRFYKGILIFIQLLVCFFSVLLFVYGYIWVTSHDALNTTSSALEIPMWIPYSVFPFAMFVTIIFSLVNIQNIVKGKQEEIKI